MNWRYSIESYDEHSSDRMSSALGLHPIIARLLNSRGIEDPNEAEHFLHPSLERLHDPFLMLDMDRAVERIVTALKEREKILIHGDFDTDGLTATAILVQALRTLGAGVSYFIPNRLEEGYGLQREGVDVARERNASLLITCDCGISSAEAVKYASSIGVDVVITDHHQPERELPEAVAVVDPHRPGCNYPFKGLAGVGVAVKLVLALSQRCNVEPQLPSLLRMCALGTVADVVPLIDENRIITSHGLALLPGTPNLGLRALLEISGLEETEISAQDVSYRIAPRLNAMGRFGKQEYAIELFFTNERKRAREIASDMNHLNTRRQRMVDRMVEQAVEMIESDPDIRSSKALVLGDRRWHKGVVGIVASKLAETYNRPTLVVAIENDVGFGSGRSIPDFHLLDGLTACEEILSRYGGHALAAGFEVPASRLGELRQRLSNLASEKLEEDSLQPHFTVDAEVKLSDLNSDFQKQFKLLEPTGFGNPNPLFLARETRLLAPPGILKERHAKLTLDTGGRVITGLAWRMANEMSHLRAGQVLDLIFSLNFNRWRGEEKLQLDIKAFQE